MKYLDLSKTNLKKWKVLVPKSNGSGALGEVLSTPLIGEPLIGYTQTFLGIGAFEKETEAKAVYKYITSKFARTMLGILKITQDNPPEKWKHVPLQDFTSSSDIDWSKSVHEIDLQLYDKYGLTEEERNFIETHVKEMA
jgi:type II restriction enzyme